MRAPDLKACRRSRIVPQADIARGFSAWAYSQRPLSARPLTRAARFSQVS